MSTALVLHWPSGGANRALEEQAQDKEGPGTLHLRDLARQGLGPGKWSHAPSGERGERQSAPGEPSC